MKKYFNELGFKEGDRIRCTYSENEMYYKAGDEFTVCLKGGSLSINTPKGYVNGYTGDWELVEPIDMTNNRVPYGLLTEEEKEVLQGWDGEYEYYVNGFVPDWKKVKGPAFLFTGVYRTVPKPKAIPVSDLKGTVEMKDGKPDWSTYSED